MAGCAGVSCSGVLDGGITGGGGDFCVISKLFLS